MNNPSKQLIKIDSLNCLCAHNDNYGRIAYILYPMDMLDNWIVSAATRYRTSIVVITGMDWQNVFSPWPAKGVPAGCPDFKGQSPQFLKQLIGNVVPRVENALGVDAGTERSLIGVSMSGLFAVWQWMLCSAFVNIASLSGSFWYEGFTDWLRSRDIPHKPGKAYFLLGDKEAGSKVKEFSTVADRTREVIADLRNAGIRTMFESVPGDHYSNPIPRLEHAFTALYATTDNQ